MTILEVHLRMQIVFINYKTTAGSSRTKKATESSPEQQNTYLQLLTLITQKSIAPFCRFIMKGYTTCYKLLLITMENLSMQPSRFVRTKRPACTLKGKASSKSNLQKIVLHSSKGARIIVSQDRLNRMFIAQGHTPFFKSWQKVFKTVGSFSEESSIYVIWQDQRKYTPMNNWGHSTYWN